MTTPSALTKLRENLAGNITLFSHHKAILLRLVDEKIAALRAATRPAPTEAVREALKPFAKIQIGVEGNDSDEWFRHDGDVLTVGDFRKARAALSVGEAIGAAKPSISEQIARDIREGTFPNKSQTTLREELLSRAESVISHGDNTTYPLRSAATYVRSIMCELADALRAALPSEVIGREWQPIETAPRDRFIFLYCPEDQSRWLAKWQGGEWYGSDCEHGIRRTGHSLGDPDFVTGWFVSHWMPLPAGPSVTRPTRGGDA